MKMLFVSLVLLLLLLSFGSNVRMHQNRNTLTPYKEVRCSFKPAAKTLQPVSQDNNITVYTTLVMTTFRVFSCFYHPVISQHVGSLLHEKQGARTHKPDSISDREIGIFISFPEVSSFSYDLLLPFQSLASDFL